MLLRGVGTMGGGIALPDVVDSYAGKFTTRHLDGLLAYWRLNETVGTTAAAFPTTGYVGTYNGVTLDSTIAPGGGAAPSFDGVNDYVSLNTTYVDDNFLGTSGTMSIWANDSSQNNHSIMLFWAATSARTPFNIIPTADLINYTRSAGGVTDVIQEGDVTWDFSTWVQYTVTWDESDDIINLYRDGILVGSTDGIGAWGVTSVSSNYLGVSQALSQDFQGEMAHAALWNKTLDTSAIENLASTKLTSEGP